jgi:vesicular inhibitory amino acid transporter
LSLLAYTSILGIVSSVLIIFVVLFDGFSKLDSPGSIWSPAQTTFGVGNWNSMGLAFGLFMAGVGCAYQADDVSLLTLYQFSGHAVIPSLATDMVDPTQFDTMINWAFVSLQLQHDLFENSLNSIF